MCIRDSYFTAGPHDYWDTGWKWRQREIAGCEPLDPPSRYNHHFSAAKDPHDDNDDLETESLDQDAYNLAVLVDHNPTNRPGWGCAIFLHCDDGSRTWGCITIGEDVLSDLLPLSLIHISEPTRLYPKSRMPSSA